MKSDDLGAQGVKPAYQGVLFKPTREGFQKLVHNLNKAHVSGYELVGGVVRLDKTIAAVLRKVREDAPDYEFFDEGDL